MIESFLFFAYMKYGSVSKASTGIGVGERTFGNRGVKPRSADITLLEDVVNAKMLLDSIEQKRVAPETPQECGLRDVTAFIRERPDEFLVLIQSDLDARRGNAVTA